MAEISETKVAQLYNESLDVISRFNKLTPEELNDLRYPAPRLPRQFYSNTITTRNRTGDNEFPVSGRRQDVVQRRGSGRVLQDGHAGYQEITAST